MNNKNKRNNGKQRRKKAKKILVKKSHLKQKKLCPTKAELNIIDQIIKENNIDINTKEGEQQLLKILHDMGKNNIY